MDLHNEAVLLRRFENDRGNLGLSQRDKCFEPALATDQVVMTANGGWNRTANYWHLKVPAPTPRAAR